MAVSVEVTVKEGGKKFIGDEPRKPYKGQIQVNKFGFDVLHSRAGVPGTRKFLEAVPAVSTSFEVEKLPDSASPDLYAACAHGLILDPVVLTETKVVNKRVIETCIYRLRDAVISTIGTTSNGDSGRIEKLRFDFAKMEIEHKKPDGTPVRTEIDFVTGS
jgi:type VI protein secretion system component Hcp